MRRAGYGVFVGALLFAGNGSAQVAPGGDRGGDAGDLSGEAAIAPLRLSLEGAMFSIARAFPNCASREDDVGNSVGGIPVQKFASVRLAPRLVLSGFAQLGCPIDAGSGRGLTYTLPVAPSIWVVFSAGVYSVPAQAPLFGGFGPSFVRGLAGAPSPVNTAVRADVMWKGVRGNTYNLGVESYGLGRHTVTFGAGMF